jgi:hypothetical protein
LTFQEGYHTVHGQAAGVDGTDGEHPRYTNVIGNLVREVGMYEKQCVDRTSFNLRATTKTPKTGVAVWA